MKTFKTKFMVGATFNVPTWMSGSNTVPSEVDGCDECNRSGPKPWPVFTVNYHGVEVCAKCLTRMDAPRRPISSSSEPIS